MPSIGTTTKPPDTYWERYGATYNQAAMLYTMPEDGIITRLGQWIGAYGSSATVRLCVWSASGTNLLLANSGLITVARNDADVDQYEADLLTPLELDSGVQFYAGFSRDPSKDHYLQGNAGNHVDNKRSTWPGNLDGHTDGDHGFGSHGIGSYVANYDLAAAMWVRRSGIWVRAEGIYVRRGGDWVRAEGIQVRRSGAWIDAD